MMRNIFYASLFFTGFFGLCFFIFFNMVFHNEHFLSDLPVHINAARNFTDPHISIPHPLFHFLTFYGALLSGLSVEYTAILVCCALCVGYGIFTLLVLNHFLNKNYSFPFLLFMTAILLLASAVYLPFFNTNIYLGQGSPNIWHSPTLFVIKPLALGITLLLAVFVENPRWQCRAEYLVLLGGLILISLFAKPNFVMAFLPACGLFILIRYPKRFDLYWKTALLFLPAVVYLGYQYLMVYGSTSSAQDSLRDHIIFDFFGVMRSRTRSVFFSFLLTMAFPIALVLCRIRTIFRSNLLLLAWLTTLVGVAQAGLLAEQTRYNEGNFIWGYLIALNILFIFSLQEFLTWMAHPDGQGWWEKTRIAVCSVLLSLHFVSGVYYVAQIASGHGYF